MKKKLLGILAVACALCSLAGPITAELGDKGGPPVVILSRGTAFSAYHIGATYASVHLSKDGQPYVPNGSSLWVWTKDQNGNLVSWHASNFGLRKPTLLGSDAALFSPSDEGRMFPDEAIEPVASVSAGAQVVIQSRALGDSVSARVIGTDTDNGEIYLDYIPGIGDSDSKVNDAKGVFVGLLSSLRKDPNTLKVVGVTVITPRLNPLIGTTPAPKPPQPTPTPDPTFTQDQLNQAVAAAKATERAATVAKLQAVLDAIK